MQELDKKYMNRLDELIQQIQASEHLANYLENEEEEDYMQLREVFEPQISDLHNEIAENNPLQLVSCEKKLLEDGFEGLFLPRVLGYSVLRGVYNDDFKYLRPQNHFKNVLLSICNSANFDILKKRIGQSIQTGFALSSDIWITNLINSINNKRVRFYLQGHKLEKYRDPKQRAIGYARYVRQFTDDHYQTAEFPETAADLKVLFPQLKKFLIHRIKRKSNNESLLEPLRSFISNKAFKNTDEHMEVMGLFSLFFELDEKDKKELSKHFEATRKEMPSFVEKFLTFGLNLHRGDVIDLVPEADLRLSANLDKSVKDELSNYYTLMDTVHAKGFVNDEAQAAIKKYYNKNEGVSLENKCVRACIFSYFERFMSGLIVDDYSPFFDIAKVYPIYIDIFANQKFNQQLKDLSMKYILKLMKKYTDKRGKDYQDIKKFVTASFLDFKFMNEKELVELFKTRRKKRKVTS